MKESHAKALPPGSSGAYSRKIIGQFDAAAAHYDTLYTDPIAMAEKEAVMALLPKCVNVLDVGCGTGLLLDLTSHWRPGRYVGIDPSLGMLNRALAKHPGHDFCGVTLPEFKLPELTGNLHGRRFEGAVSLFGSMSYSTDPDSDAAALWDVLVPGGKAMIMLAGNGLLRRGPRWKGCDAPPPAPASVSRDIYERAGFKVGIQGMGLHRDGMLDTGLTSGTLSGFLVLEMVVAGQGSSVDAANWQIVHLSKPL